jgi:hypothetical protein
MSFRSRRVGAWSGANRCPDRIEIRARFRRNLRGKSPGDLPFPLKMFENAFI